jgi:FMN-dependent NADH-azoreductase
LALSDALIRELVTADIIVLADPMYNFGIPSTLNAWIDHVVRAGSTFTYAESCGTPRGAGGIPSRWNVPKVLLSRAIGQWTGGFA